MRAALVDQKTGIVVNVLDVQNLSQVDHLVLAQESGNIGDWRDDDARQFVTSSDPRHPLYVAPERA